MTLRPAWEFIKQTFPNKKIVGIQTGVMNGEYTEIVLNEIPNIKTLYLVDPYEVYDKYVAYRNPSMEPIGRSAHIKLEKYNDRIVWIKKYMDDTVASDIDFVYLDGNRLYDHVYRDIINGIRSTKKGGIISGCGFDDPLEDTRWNGISPKNDVRKAIETICEKYKIQLSIAGTDWWFVNPFTKKQAIDLQYADLPLRPAWEFINKTFNKKIVGMEVGVEDGENSEKVLSKIPQIKKLYLVDPYEIYADYWDYKPFEGGMKPVEDVAHQRLKKYTDRIVWKKDFFNKDIVENLDFIYIDGNHRYDAVMHDIVNGIKSVKKDGIIAGHDYDIISTSQQVRTAVDNFCKKYNIKLHSKEIYSPRFNRMIGDWWFVNPFSKEEAIKLEVEPLKKVRSWDIINTIITWKRGPIEQIFSDVERDIEIKDLAQKRINAENNLIKEGKEYSLEDIYKRYLLDEGRVDDSKARIYSIIEFEHSMKNIFLIKENYDKIQDGDILINDTYYTIDQIKNLLLKAGFNKNCTIYTALQGKRNGYIWGELTSLYEIVCHTGDDDSSDIIIPNSLGIPIMKANTSLNSIEKMYEKEYPEMAYTMRFYRLTKGEVPLFSNDEPKQVYSKICAVSAVYNDEGCLPTFFQKLDALTHKISYHIFVTNNCTDQTDPLIDEYLKTHPGKRISYNMHKDFVKKIGDPYAPAAIAWQCGLRVARKIFESDLSYTHVLYLDSDVFIETTDAIERATAREQHIVAGPYLRDFPNGRHLAGIFKVDDVTVKILPQYEKDRGQYFYFDNVFFDFIQVPFTSNGFCLYDRTIVMDTRVNFWPIFKLGPDYIEHKECSPEFGYQNRAYFLGYYTWLDGSIKLSHYLGYRHRPHRGDGKTYVDFQYYK
jgi:hypothetical protein